MLSIDYHSESVCVHWIYTEICNFFGVSPKYFGLFLERTIIIRVKNLPSELTVHYRVIIIVFNFVKYVSIRFDNYDVYCLVRTTRGYLPSGQVSLRSQETEAFYIFIRSIKASIIKQESPFFVTIFDNESSAVISLTSHVWS